MKKHARVMLLSIMFLAVLVLTAQVSFAWLSRIEKSAPIIIETGTLKLNSTLYVLDDDEYKLISSSIINFEQVTPGKQYSFKAIFKNEGTVDGILTFSINNVFSGVAKTLENFQINYLNPTTMSPISITLNNNTNGSILLFENYLIGDKYELNNTFEFYFTLSILDSLDSSSKGDVVTIENFLARIVQYH